MHHLKSAIEQFRRNEVPFSVGTLVHLSEILESNGILQSFFHVYTIPNRCHNRMEIFLSDNNATVNVCLKELDQKMQWSSF